MVVKRLEILIHRRKWEIINAIEAFPISVAFGDGVLPRLTIQRRVSAMFVPNKGRGSLLCFVSFSGAKLYQPFRSTVAPQQSEAF